VKRLSLASKLFVSATLSVGPILAIVFFPTVLKDPLFAFPFAVLLFSAVSPWLNSTTATRGLAVAGAVFSLGAGLLAGRAALGLSQLPLRCIGSRTAWCELGNVLFAIGGRYLVATAIAIPAALLLAGSVRMFLRAGREQETP
jgi:hypothetical protein